MEHLRADIVSYEEVKTERCKLLESNSILKKQLEEQVQAFQLATDDLKARSNQMERDLNNLRDNCDFQRKKPELERKNFDLHERLKDAKVNLEAANVKMKKTQQQPRCLEQDEVKYKVFLPCSWLCLALIHPRNVLKMLKHI